MQHLATEDEMKSLCMRIEFVALLALLARPTQAAISFVQVADRSARSVSALTQALSSNTTVGDLLVVTIRHDPTVSVSSVADSQGNTFAAVSGSATGSSASGNLDTYYAKNIVGGADTVTVKLNASADIADIFVSEYSGADTSSPLDAATGAGGSGTVGNSGPVTTASANDLIYGLCADGGGTPSAGTGFTLRALTDKLLDEDALAAAAGSYAVTVSLGGDYDWTCQMAAFRPAGSAAASTESVALSAKFTWDTGAAVQGSVVLSQQATSGTTQIGQWTINNQGSVSATLTLQVWGFYSFQLLDTSGNLLQNGAIVAFPTLQSGNLQVVLASSTKQVKSAKFTVAMGSLITTGPS
jgi:hypothetical protein